eukprot:scaffold8535_cov49-Phaeocystis_antarctica.AAC.3
MGWRGGWCGGRTGRSRSGEEDRVEGGCGHWHWHEDLRERHHLHLHPQVGARAVAQDGLLQLEVDPAAAELARGRVEQRAHATLHGGHPAVDNVHHQREAAEDEGELERDGQQELGEAVVPRREQQPRVDRAEQHHGEQVDQQKGEQ